MVTSNVSATVSARLLRRLQLCALLVILPAASLSAYATEYSTRQLGYLFTSPAQRETLDTVREQYQRGLYKGEGTAAEVSGYKFNGLISKQGREQRLWVNGSEAQGRKAGAGRYRLELPPGRIKLKPGQVYQPGSDKVLEAYEHNTP